MAVVVAGFPTGIWVDVVIVVTTVGLGLVGKIRFTGKVTFTLDLLPTGALALFFFSAFLGTGVFCGKEF